MENGLQVQDRAVARISDEMSVDEAVARFRKIEELAARVLHEAKEEGTGDYGVVPGTKRKVLFKSGAEKLCTVFRLGAFYSAETVEREGKDAGHVTYTVRCTLKHQPTGAEVGSALGLCSSLESKYRYRMAGRVCPECSAEAIIKGREEYGGGWLCFKKRGGCGAKFRDGDAAIEGQEVGKIENPDIADVENTVLKMAEKRAHVAATLNALAISSLFTQDIIPDNSGEPEQAPSMRTEHESSGTDAAPAQGSADGVSRPAESGLSPGCAELRHAVDEAGQAGSVELARVWSNKTFQAKFKALNAAEQESVTALKNDWKAHYETRGA
jgi:hypothetical protein